MVERGGSYIPESEKKNIFEKILVPLENIVRNFLSMLKGKGRKQK